DSHGHPGVGRHVEGYIEPRLVIVAHMHDGSQRYSGSVLDVSILPVEADAVGGARPVPVGRGPAPRRYRDCLVKRAISRCLASWQTAHVTGKRASVDGGATARTPHKRSRVGVIHYPGWKATGLESPVYNYPTITWRRRRCGSWSRRSRW